MMDGYGNKGMILDVNTEAADMDMDYFQQLIEGKVEKRGQKSYAELLAIRQMSGDCEAEGKLQYWLYEEYGLIFVFSVFVVEELSNALAEIRKSEKEMSMIAMVAQTLIERTNDL